MLNKRHYKTLQEHAAQSNLTNKNKTRCSGNGGLGKITKYIHSLVTVIVLWSHVVDTKHARCQNIAIVITI